MAHGSGRRSLGHTAADLSSPAAPSRFAAAVSNRILAGRRTDGARNLEATQAAQASPARAAVAQSVRPPRHRRLGSGPGPARRWWPGPMLAVRAQAHHQTSHSASASSPIEAPPGPAPSPAHPATTTRAPAPSSPPDRYAAHQLSSVFPRPPLHMQAP